jgi:DNA polymerase III subunit delta'
MGFGEIVGHARQLELLRAALAKGRLHHGYLFVGPAGIGKRTIAMALAQAVHCGETHSEGCGRCADCVRISDGNHPDVRVVQPLEGKKEISIQQVREIERELRYRSFGGRRKITIVDPAGAMNASAQNALLKTLEEPPENSLIILIAPNMGELLPTLRSRCLRLSFAPLSRSAVVGFLQTREKRDGAKADLLAAMSMGSIGMALNLDEQEVIEKRRTWSAVLGELTRGDYQGAIAAAEPLAADREGVLEFLRWAESWYRDLLVHGVTREQEGLVNLDMLSHIEQQSARSGGVRALPVLEQIGAATAAIQRNLNRRMVLEKFLFAVIEGR